MEGRAGRAPSVLLIVGGDHVVPGRLRLELAVGPQFRWLADLLDRENVTTRVELGNPSFDLAEDPTLGNESLELGVELGLEADIHGVDGAAVKAEHTVIALGLLELVHDLHGLADLEVERFLERREDQGSMLDLDLVQGAELFAGLEGVFDDVPGVGGIVVQAPVVGNLRD